MSMSSQSWEKAVQSLLRNRSISQQQLQTIMQLRALDVNKADIAETVGVDRSTLHRLLAEIEVPENTDTVVVAGHECSRSRFVEFVIADLPTDLTERQDQWYPDETF